MELDGRGNSKQKQKSKRKKTKVEGLSKEARGEKVLKETGGAKFLVTFSSRSLVVLGLGLFITVSLSIGSPQG